MLIDENKYQALLRSFSNARLSTYFKETQQIPQRAIQLYQWNAEVSAAFLPTLQIFEITLRNAVAEVLEKLYGKQWAWNQNFILSLKNKNNSSNELSLREQPLTCSKGEKNINNVIPKLSFFFWQKFFTRNFTDHIWKNDLHEIFPNINQNQSPRANIILMYAYIDSIRKLRNRIAHHEPIFRMNLIEEYQKILEFVGLRCIVTESWLKSNTKYLPKLILKSEKLLTAQN